MGIFGKIRNIFVTEKPKLPSKAEIDPDVMMNSNAKVLGELVALNKRLQAGSPFDTGESEWRKRILQEGKDLWPAA